MDNEKPALPVNEQAKENFAKAAAQVIMSMIESGEASKLLKEKDDYKAG